MESKLTYFRWYVDEAQLIKEQLTNEQAGELFISVMDYLRDGTSTEVSPAIKWPYLDYQHKIDRSREAYEKKCAINAENGAKGGTAKAENAKKRGSGCSATYSCKFVPPTKKQFIAAITHGVDEGDISSGISGYDIDRLFEGLSGENWTIGGEQILNRTDWEASIAIMFPPDFQKDRIHPAVLPLYESVFRYIFKTFHGLRSKDGETYADIVAADFCEEYDEKLSGWRIQGEEFPRSEWINAVEKYVRIKEVKS